jgi:hypothetical protein
MNRGLWRGLLCSVKCIMYLRPVSFFFFSFSFEKGVPLSVLISLHDKCEKMLLREWSDIAPFGILIVSTQLMQILCGHATSNFLGTRTHKRKKEREIHYLRWPIASRFQDSL